MPVLCSNCIKPIVSQVEQRRICKDCSQYLKNPITKKVRENLKNKMLEFLSKNNFIFAYSGGMDSTASLYKLIEIMGHNRLSAIFFIDHGFKGIKTIKNVSRVISDLGLNDKFVYVDLTNSIRDGKIIPRWYLEYCETQQLPCVLCGKFFKDVFESLIENETYKTNVIVTGGDIPVCINGTYNFINKKISYNNRIYYTIRSCYFLFENENDIKDYIKYNNIPWIDPGYGSWDTDCLLPGIVLYKIYNNRDKLDIFDVNNKTPEIVGYFAVRVRYGFISRDSALNKIQYPTYPNTDVLKEFEKLYSKFKYQN